MVIDQNVAIAVKNFLLNYAEVHGLPSPVRNVNRVTQSIIFLPAEMSYKSVHRDFLAGLEEDSMTSDMPEDRPSAAEALEVITTGRTKAGKAKRQCDVLNDCEKENKRPRVPVIL